MSDSANNDTLKNRHYISLILRLTLDQGGRLIQGELVDTTDTLRQRFTTLSELNEAVAAWLKQQERTDGKQDEDTLISNLPLRGLSGVGILKIPEGEAGASGEEPYSPPSREGLGGGEHYNVTPDTLFRGHPPPSQPSPQGGRRKNEKIYPIKLSEREEVVGDFARHPTNLKKRVQRRLVGDVILNGA